MRPHTPSQATYSPHSHRAPTSLHQSLQQSALKTTPFLSKPPSTAIRTYSNTNNPTHRARQAVPIDPNAAGVAAAVQFPTITTDWRPTVLPNGQTTYWPDAYTQTFAKVPDQLPSPGAGSIGFGTLKAKNGKRAAAEATPTGSVATGIAGRYRV
jgi:hypothetical protein